MIKFIKAGGNLYCFKIAILIKTILFFDPSFAQPVNLYYEDGHKPIKESYTLVNGVRNGEYSSWHFNGKLKEHGFYENGKMHGEWKIYWEKGTLWKSLKWQNDSLFQYTEFRLFGTQVINFSVDNGLYKIEYVRFLTDYHTFLNKIASKKPKVSVVEVYGGDGAYFYYSSPELSAEKYDSAAITILGSIAKNCRIVNFRDDGILTDSVIYENGKSTFWVRASFYDDSKQIPYSRRIYLNSILHEQFIYFKSLNNFNYTQYHTNNFAACMGTVYDGQRIGKWQYYDMAGNRLKLEVYKQGVLVKTK